MQEKALSYILFKTIGFCFFLLIYHFSVGQIVTGQILNEENDAVPYATIYVPDAKEGTISNSDGYFKLKISTGEHQLVIRCMGYVQVEKSIKVTSDSIFIPVVMKRQEFEIKEVKVFPGNEDPAMMIMRKAIAKAPYYREKIKHYEASLYIKSNFSFTNIPRLYQNKIEVNGQKLKDVLKENVTYVIESQNQITFDFPNKYQQKVISKKTSLVGFEEPPVMELMTTSFYEEHPNNVVSPLSPLALKRYNFKYEGFITAGKYDVFKIKVTPKRKSDELVEGYIYIVDKLWCIYSLDFNSSFEFFNYRIRQQFENLGNDNWLPVSHVIDGNFSMLGLKGLFYYGASLKYDVVEENHPEETAIEKSVVNSNVPDRKPGEKELQLRRERELIVSKEELTNADVKKAARLNRKILKEQYKDSTLTPQSYNDYHVEELKDSLANNDLYWDTIRTIPLSPAEIRSYQITDSLMATGKVVADSITGEKKLKEKSLFSKVLTGNSDLVKDSTVRLNYSGLISVNDFGYNAVDGYSYTQHMSLVWDVDSGKRIIIAPKLGYAFNRKSLIWKTEFRFRNMFWKKNEISVHTGKESRDFKPGTSGISPTLNAISSWFFAANYMKLYQSSFGGFNVIQKLGKNFTLQAETQYDHFYPLENHVSFPLSDKREYSPNIPKGLEKNSPVLAEQKSFTYSVKANYRKQINKPWLENSPFLFIDDFYRIDINFTRGIPHVFSSVSDFSHLHVTFQQQANISTSSGIDWKISAGHFFTNKQMHFSQFEHLSTSEIPVYLDDFSHTFQLLNDYEFSTNKSYLNISGEFRTEYILLRYFSFINRRTWSESLHLNYLATPKLKNYWEAGYSLNNLFFVGNVGVFAGFREKNFEQIQFKISISAFD